MTWPTREAIIRAVWPNVEPEREHLYHDQADAMLALFEPARVDMTRTALKHGRAVTQDLAALWPLAQAALAAVDRARRSQFNEIDPSSADQRAAADALPPDLAARLREATARDG